MAPTQAAPSAVLAATLKRLSSSSLVLLVWSHGFRDYHHVSRPLFSLKGLSVLTSS